MSHDEHGDSLDLTDEQLDALLHAANDDLLAYVRATVGPATGRLAALMAPIDKTVVPGPGGLPAVQHAAAVIMLRTMARALVRALDDAYDRARGHGLAHGLHLGRARVFEAELNRARSLRGTVYLGCADDAVDRSLELAHAADLDHDLARALLHAYEGAHNVVLALTLSRMRIAAIDAAAYLARARLTARNLVRDVDHARELAHGLYAALGAVPVDVSAVDLSQVEVTDLEALAGVVWTRETIWPLGMAERVELHSEEIGDGSWRVRGGGRENADVVTA